MALDLVALLISIGALLLIGRDLSRPSRPTLRRFRFLRAIPFLIFSALGLFVAARAPRGRHPFQVDLSLALVDLQRSLSKVQHVRGYAVLMLLAVVAFGPRRLLVPFLTTMALGVACELAEATAVGHYARLADLAPNLVGAGLALVVVALMRRAITPRAPAGRAA